MYIYFRALLNALFTHLALSCPYSELNAILKGIVLLLQLTCLLSEANNTIGSSKPSNVTPKVDIIQS